MADPLVFWFPTKRSTSETPVLEFDFSNLFASGATLASSSVATAVIRGTDASHAAILSTKTHSSLKVLQKVTGGLNGVIYLVSCTATDSNGVLRTIHGYLAVDDPATQETATVPSASALTRIETLKATIQPPLPGNESDVILAYLIRDVSQLIAQQNPDISLASGSVTEYRNGQGNDMIVLRKRPATAITSVKIGGSTVSASTNYGAGWVFDSESNTVWYRDGYFTRGVQNIEITYTAGISSTHAWAYLLERACLITCATWWGRMSRLDKVTESTSTGGVSVSYSMLAIPKEAQLILDDLRSKAILFE